MKVTYKTIGDSSILKVNNNAKVIKCSDGVVVQYDTGTNGDEVPCAELLIELFDKFENRFNKGGE